MDKNHIDGLGVIVNDRDGMDKSNDRSLNTDEAVIPLRVSNDVFDKLHKAANFYGFPTTEAYCIYRLIESLDRKVGQASIDAPSHFSGTETRKITGPSGLGMVSRG